MLSMLPVTLMVSTILGFLSGLGIGGGSLLILWLTAVLAMDPAVARGINLLFFVPAALISCTLRIKRRTLSFRPLIPAIISGSIAASIFSWISTFLDTDVLKKAFGIMLLCAGLRELFYRPRNAR